MSGIGEGTYWHRRYRGAEEAFQKIKNITKQVPAGSWTPEYTELAEAIHTAGREAFYVEDGNSPDYQFYLNMWQL